MARAPAISDTQGARAPQQRQCLCRHRPPNAEEHLIKAKLALKIDRLPRARNLKKIEAPKLFGSKQPDISKMLHGDFRQFFVERLLRFLVAFGQDAEIVVGEHRKAREHRNGKGSLALPVA